MPKTLNQWVAFGVSVLVILFLVNNVGFLSSLVSRR